MHLPGALQSQEDTTVDPRRDRIRHGHGQAFRDVARAVRGRVAPLPDVVAYPRTATDVAAVLDWATESGVAVVPYGGGSSGVAGSTGGASVTFPDVTAGARAVRDVVQAGLDPANCGLLDPTEAAPAGDGDTTVLVLGFESADRPMHHRMTRTPEVVAAHGGVVADGPHHHG